MSLRDKRRRMAAEELAPGAAFPYKRILLTFAGLPQAEEVFQLALHLAAGTGGDLFLLRVVPGGGEGVDKEPLYSELRAINTLLEAAAIPAGLEAVPAPGPETIVAYAEERQVDLIIAVGRAANGEAYRRLVEALLRQAPCATMMLCAAPPAGEREAEQTAGGRHNPGAAASAAAHRVERAAATAGH